MIDGMGAEGEFSPRNRNTSGRTRYSTESKTCIDLIGMLLEDQERGVHHMNK